MQHVHSIEFFCEDQRVLLFLIHKNVLFGYRSSSGLAHGPQVNNFEIPRSNSLPLTKCLYGLNHPRPLFSISQNILNHLIVKLPLRKKYWLLIGVAPFRIWCLTLRKLLRLLVVAADEIAGCHHRMLGLLLAEARRTLLVEQVWQILGLV